MADVAEQQDEPYNQEDKSVAIFTFSKVHSVLSYLRVDAGFNSWYTMNEMIATPVKAEIFPPPSISAVLTPSILFGSF